MRLREIVAVLMLLWLALVGDAAAQPAATSPKPAATVPVVVDTHTARAFPEITTKAQWQERASLIREQLLVSGGLWPMPQKTPLHAEVFGKIIRDGYSIEKVHLQPVPGFYLAGNLYRPLGQGNGPFPGIINPHGHWENGRLTDSAICSIPGRCINFARQGFVAFSYDLVGYNDTHFPEAPTNATFTQLHRSFATNNPAALLWSVSLMGLQTWNNIRALDFIAALPDVDPRRLACTGGSGGGGQTFNLGAIDDRLAVLAPVVMVSHVMQGGCLCENMPGLRIEFSNVEIAAAAAPRPQIMVADTGDWTKSMLTVEGPAVEHIYQLFEAPQNLRYVCLPAPHNYNQASREAVYQWFDKCLLNAPDQPVKELAYQKEPDAVLRVFPDGKLPADALSEAALIQYLIKAHQNQLRALQPKDQASLAKYRGIMEPARSRTLQLGISGGELDSGLDYLPKQPGYSEQRISVHVPGEGHARSVLRFTPVKTNAAPQPLLVILAHSSGAKTCLDQSNAPIGLARELLDRAIEVAVVEDGPALQTANEQSVLFNTYNRTRLQEEVRDLINICNAVKGLDFKNYRVVLCAGGQAAYWSLLAAPAAYAVVADCGSLDVSNDQNLLAPGLFCPGVRNIDTFNGSLILAAPHPLLLCNLNRQFDTASLSATYKILKAQKKLRLETKPFSDEQIVSWISGLEH